MTVSTLHDSDKPRNKWESTATGIMHAYVFIPTTSAPLLSSSMIIRRYHQKLPYDCHRFSLLLSLFVCCSRHRLSPYHLLSFLSSPPFAALVCIATAFLCSRFYRQRLSLLIFLLSLPFIAIISIVTAFCFYRHRCLSSIPFVAILSPPLAFVALVAISSPPFVMPTSTDLSTVGNLPQLFLDFVDSGIVNSSNVADVERLVFVGFTVRII